MPVYPVSFYGLDYDNERDYENLKNYEYIGELISHFDFELIQKAQKDKTTLKQILRDALILELINETEKCIADKSNIRSDEIKKTYRERWYETGLCYSRDGGLVEEIYYNSSIPYIYLLERLDFIKIYEDSWRLSILQLIYPAKMPTKDYFPFIEFDIGTKIPLLLTEKEKERYKDNIDDFSSYKISDDDWCYCILWLDKDRMLMNLIDSAYYFKQVGKNVHLFRLIIPL